MTDLPHHALHLLSKAIRFCIAVFSEAVHLLNKSSSDHRHIRSSDVDDILIYIPSHGPGLGDLLQFKPVIMKLNEEWSGVRLHLVMNKPEEYRQVFADRHLFDSVIFFQQRGTLREQVEILREVRQLDADLLMMDFHSISFLSSIISLFSGIPYRVGHCSSSRIPVIWSYAFNYPVRLKHDLHRKHQYALLLNKLPIDSTVRRPPSIDLDQETIDQATEYLDHHGVRADYITIAPGSGSQPWKRWAPDKFARLSDQLIEAKDKTIVFVGSDDEDELIKDITESMEFDAVNSAGDLTMKEAAAVIQNSEMLICNSCGLMHVAHAVDTAIFAIYGPIYRNAFPYAEEHQMIQKLYPDEPVFDNYWDQDFYTRRRCKRRGIDHTTVEEVFTRIVASDT